MAESLRASTKELLASRGFRPRKSLGQNFLVDARRLREIAEAAEIGPADFVLEAGAGTFLLTRELAARAGRVLAVEVDAILAEICREEAAAFPNVEVVEGSLLGRGDTLAPAVQERISRAVSSPGAADPSGRRGPKPVPLKMASNLPYSAGSPILLAALESGLPFERIVATVQREVAGRLAARPGSGEYGLLTVLVQSLARVELLRDLPPSAFFPVPEVVSSVVRLSPGGRLDPASPDYALLKRLARPAFAKRRKTLRAALRSLLEGEGRAAALPAALAVIGKGPDLRAEECSWQELVSAARAIFSP